jgi:hypothetical protein
LGRQALAFGVEPPKVVDERFAEEIQAAESLPPMPVVRRSARHGQERPGQSFR